MSALKAMALVGALDLIICGFAQVARSEIIMELKTPVELEQQAETPVPAAPPTASELGFQFHLPLAKLSNIVNQFRFTIPAGGDSVTSVQVSLSSSGISDYPLQFQVPIKLHVIGTDLDGTATLNIAIGVAPDGCPLKFQPPSVNFPNGGIIGAIASQKVASEISAQLSCDNIKQQLAKIWKPFELPITFGSNAIYVNFGPQKVAISALSVDTTKNEVIFGGNLSAVVTLTSKGGQGPQAAPMNISHIASPGSGTAEFNSTTSLSLYPNFGKK